MQQEDFYCYIEDCVVYASDKPEDKAKPLGKAIVNKYDSRGYFYIEGGIIYYDNGYTGELEPRGGFVPFNTDK